MAKHSYSSTMRPKMSGNKGGSSKKGAKYAGTQPMGKKARYIGAV